MSNRTLSQVRALAKAQGFRIVMCRTRSASSPDLGKGHVVELDFGAVVLGGSRPVTPEEMHEWLTERAQRQRVSMPLVSVGRKLDHELPIDAQHAVVQWVYGQWVLYFEDYDREMLDHSLADGFYHSDNELIKLAESYLSAWRANFA